jgi:hypothetical protein
MAEDHAGPALLPAGAGRPDSAAASAASGWRVDDSRREASAAAVQRPYSAALVRATCCSLFCHTRAPALCADLSVTWAAPSREACPQACPRAACVSCWANASATQRDVMPGGAPCPQALAVTSSWLRADALTVARARPLPYREAQSCEAPCTVAARTAPRS